MGLEVLTRAICPGVTPAHRNFGTGYVRILEIGQRHLVLVCLFRCPVN